MLWRSGRRRRRSGKSSSYVGEEIGLGVELEVARNPEQVIEGHAIVPREPVV